MRISVILPVLNEERTIGASLEALLVLAPDEIIVVDGGSTDRTQQICARLGVSVITSNRGRARQMNRGAKEATGDVLLFLHADTTLPASAPQDVRAAMRDPDCPGGRFDVEIDGAHWMLKVIARLINCRSRVTKVATGDQALFVRRAVFESMGGFQDIPLMEDIAFCRALKRIGPIACLHTRVITSGRRWERHGVWRTVIKMWALKVCYLAGVSPRRLKQFYADTR
ncbi:MAG TPA: TIGR04283 family arsenosugar biosynthesis glycosyltransferase [Candidatus Binatia bacterium]|jgi:rSAM/selenodomain-associated transferase 2